MKAGQSAPPECGTYLVSAHCFQAMAKYKVEFSDKTTTLPEHELDFPDVHAAREGAMEIAGKLRAAGMIMYGSNFSDWQMVIMDANGKTVGEFPLEEHEDT